MAGPPNEPVASAPWYWLWLPVAGYLALIFTLSAQPFLRPPVSFPNVDKVCHFLEYSVLGMLLARALRRAARLPLAAGLAVLALVLASIVGAADERFQAGVPGRQSDAWDWAADTAGAAVGSLVYALASRRDAGASS